jgi:hypothetical protein
MLDRGIHSNAMILASLNASCIDALRQPILFCCASHLYQQSLVFLVHKNKK